ACRKPVDLIPDGVGSRVDRLGEPEGGLAAGRVPGHERKGDLAAVVDDLLGAIGDGDLFPGPSGGGGGPGEDTGRVAEEGLAAGVARGCLLAGEELEGGNGFEEHTVPVQGHCGGGEDEVAGILFCPELVHRPELEDLKRSDALAELGQLRAVELPE